MISAKYGETDIHIGDTLRVHTKVVEGAKGRIQVFEGILIRLRGRDVNKTFTVRKIASGVGVERIFPIHSPIIAKLEVVKSPIVRKAKLYYARTRLDNTVRTRKAPKPAKKK